MNDSAGGLPDRPLLAMLDADSQGWVLARSVRDSGTIVDFELIYINDVGCRIVDRPRQELIGRRYRDLWPETVHDGTLPLYCGVVQTQEPVTRTVYYDRATVAGHFEMTVSPYGDGFGVRFVDLRQVTVAPQSVGGARLYDMLDAAFDGFTLLRAVRDSASDIVDFTCEYVNQWGAKLAGRAVEDVIGHLLSDVSANSWDNGLFGRYRTVALTGEPWRQELSFPHVGQVWEVKIGRGDDDAVAVSFREITEQVDQQEQLRLAAARAEQAAARASALQSVTTALVAASTTAQVCAAIGSVLRPSAGGTGLALLLRGSEGLRLGYHAGYEPDVVERLLEVPLDHPYPATEVARTGQPRYLGSMTEFRSTQQDAADPIPGGGRQAWAFLPLTAAGEVLGTLVVGYGQPRSFDADEQATLTALAGLSAQALQRALLFEARTSMAATLQRALLPAVLPATPGLRHAARYLPWTRGVDVGGDWYDIIALDDDVVGVVIGDVAGHSADAAATMGQVRNALRAYAIERHSPTAVMGHVNRLLWNLRLHAMVTCCYVEVHLGEGTATAVLAGHSPPMLRTTTGAFLLPLRPGVPLGVARDAVYLDTTFAIMPGDSLLLYTDGLVEDRRHPIDRGFEELCTALQHAPTRDPDAILDHILARNVGPQPRTDDVAMICLTSDVPAPTTRTAQRRFRGAATSVAAAHRFVADILTAWEQQPSIDDARQLIDDLMTHTMRPALGDFTVHLSQGRAVRVEVTDTSKPPPAIHPGADSLPADTRHVWFELPHRS